MDVLGKLFGTENRIKIMRLFLFNANQAYSADDIVVRSKANRYVVKHELNLLKKIRLIKPKSFLKDIHVKKGKSLVNKKKRTLGWMLNDKFSYLVPIQNLLINTVLLRDEEIIKKFNSVGRIKLLTIAGLFIQDWDSRLDLLIVGDALRLGVLDRVIKDIEAEIGKELRFAAFETSEFEYRLGMYDKLIRDVLDYPHRKLVNRLESLAK